MRIKHTTGDVASLVHEGVVYQPEEDGYFRIPFTLAESFLRHPAWEAEPARVVVHEPEPVPEPDKESDKESEKESEEPELTPAQKAAATRAANKAAAEADTE